MRFRDSWIPILVAGLALIVAPAAPPRTVSADAVDVIVRGSDLAAAAAAVHAARGEVTRELGIIDSVAARVSRAHLPRLESDPRVRQVVADRPVATASTPPFYQTDLSGASSLHEDGVTGRGVTVAVLDTGWKSYSYLATDSYWRSRVLAQFDALNNQATSVPDYSGHGTHVASIVASRKEDYRGRKMGAAPGARFVMVKAFDSYGRGTYASVIGGINWIVANRSRYDIRVLNCSFSAPVHSWYWEDPLNRAVMAAWQAGIVVVASAGNSGPSPMSVGVPGNVPYVITVGAMTDSFTPGVASDDRLASFSAAGPTFEGFVKPDLVAPGGHMLGHMDEDQRIARAHPEFETTSGSIFVMSGTSQAAAVVSGVAALMLQVNPDLSPDDVKCGLMASARAAQKPDGTSPYSVFQQGAGVVNAWDAVYGATSRCANNGLDVAQDLAGTRHYAGPAAQDGLGNYVLMDQTGSGTTWNGTYSRTGGYPWSDGYPWSSGYPWSNGYPWSTGYPWSNGYPWSTGYPWSSGRVEPTNINSWVPQE